MVRSRALGVSKVRLLLAVAFSIIAGVRSIMPLIWTFRTEILLFAANCEKNQPTPYKSWLTIPDFALAFKMCATIIL